MTKTMNKYHNDTIHAIRRRLVARNVIPFDFGSGITATDIDFNESEDIGICNVTYHETHDRTMKVYWADVEVPADKELSSSTIIADAFSKIEDTLLLIGAKDTVGLQSLAGNCIMAPPDFVTFGNAMNTVRDARHLIAEDGYAVNLGCDLIINRTQYLKLFTVSQNGLPEWCYLRMLLSGGHIYHTPAMPDGQGLLLPTHKDNTGFFKVKLNIDFTIQRIQPHNEGDDKWRIWFSIDPIEVTNPNVMCRLEHI